MKEHKWLLLSAVGLVLGGQMVNIKFFTFGE
jgi:hypothetical protein